MWKEVKLKTTEQLIAEGWEREYHVGGTWGLVFPTMEVNILPHQTVYLGHEVKVNFNKDGSFIYRDSWYPDGLVDGIDKVEQAVNKMRKEIGLRKKPISEELEEIEEEMLEYDLEIEIEKVMYNRDAL